MVSFELVNVLYLDLSTYQIYGLFFLLGSLTVATISDLKRMKAQTEFFELWLGFTIIMFFSEAYFKLGKEANTQMFVIKWALILVSSLLSYRKIGLTFKLAKMDVAAITAVVALFSPLKVIIFWILLRLVTFLEQPILPKSERGYPFLPVVLTTVALILMPNLKPILEAIP